MSTRNRTSNERHHGAKAPQRQRNRTTLDHNGTQTDRRDEQQQNSLRTQNPTPPQANPTTKHEPATTDSNQTKRSATESFNRPPTTDGTNKRSLNQQHSTRKTPQARIAATTRTPATETTERRRRRRRHEGRHRTATDKDKPHTPYPEGGQQRTIQIQFQSN